MAVAATWYSIGTFAPHSVVRLSVPRSNEETASLPQTTATRDVTAARGTNRPNLKAMLSRRKDTLLALPIESARLYLQMGPAGVNDRPRDHGLSALHC